MTEGENLKRFGAYQKALALFDLTVADLSPLLIQPALHRLIAQQYASATNIEEGYGRGSRKDHAHFLIIARGSAQETSGRYRRLRHWSQQPVVEARVALCNEIVGILSATINTLRKSE
ncbi:MAG TPA: four helix bundle protein [Opitutaceae bacterium]|nr:four helix bundle protein [Opitutaceae bacterium]